jgi:hypothetical protein
MVARLPKLGHRARWVPVGAPHLKISAVCGLSWYSRSGVSHRPAPNGTRVAYGVVPEVAHDP